LYHLTMDKRAMIFKARLLLLTDASISVMDT
jgi:hypothetical protein